ncbi:MAG: VWA domain-containing protein [Symploca sp. SIO2G7]|nr:VWA domain-containing protein [Symploca sp. SIO2G7]
MTVFSTLKLSLITLLTIVLSPLPPAYANSIAISRLYDWNQRVYVRVKVVDDNNVPIKSLNQADFTVESNGESIEDFTLIKPDDVKPDPSRLIILLDMSGSMNSPDNSGEIRGIAATQAIRSFTNYIETQNLPTEVTVIPFAKRGQGCGKDGYTPPVVTSEAISNKFFAPGSTELLNQLSSIERKFQEEKKYKRPCGSTDIRQPLKTAIQYFKTNYADDENISEPKTRLGIILISDGYDQVLSSAPSELGELEKLIENSPLITINTLGYGLSDGKGEDRVDTVVLERIATASGGFNKFSGDETEIQAALEDFLTALLGEYEIIYQPTITERESQQTVEVGFATVSAQKRFRINSLPTLPLDTRVQILALTLGLGLILVVLPFLSWRWLLEKNA